MNTDQKKMSWLWVQVFNLNSPQTVYKELDSPLKFQTRCITCFPDATGYLVSCIMLCSPKEHLNRCCTIIFTVSAACCALCGEEVAVSVKIEGLKEPGCPQVGSIEGRVAVQHVEDSMQSKNFTFKCHRDGNDVYAVNSIVFHPQCVTITHTTPTLPNA